MKLYLDTEFNGHGGWLPEHTFGTKLSGYALSELWRGCREKGCRSYTLEIAEDGTPRVAKD